jgi:hypothetical protein
MYTRINEQHNKLLITLGDSWTQGVGDYDPAGLRDFEDGIITQDKLYSMSVDRFYQNSWTVKLTEKLGYDLINLAKGGDSTSASVKRLMCDFDEKNTIDLDRYESVSVLWLLSDPFRFSFYSNHELHSWNASSGSEIVKWYSIDVHKSDLDGWLETKFALKIVDNYCRLKNFNFLFGSAFTDITPLDTIYNNVKNIHHRIPERKISEFLNAKRYWAHCGHPNGEGYIKIADSLYETLITKFKGMI